MKKENLEVLLEDINSKFNLVLEGHEILRNEISELSRKNDERFDLIDLKIDALGKRGDTLEGKIDSLEEKVDAIAADLSAHRADTEAHHGDYHVMEREG